MTMTAARSKRVLDVVSLVLAALIATAAPVLAQTEPPVTPAQEQTLTPVPAQPAAEQVTEVTAPADAEERDATLPHNLSPWGMFMAADWVVKVVMIGLAFASLVTWTVWVAKSLELAGANARAKRALNGIIEARSLREASEKLSGRKGPAALMVQAAAHEVSAADGTLGFGGGDGLGERVSSHLGRTQAQAARHMTRGTGVLAAIGSTAPFVGLF